jgi:predicted GNAT superfamily acetyltransferase
VTAPQYRIRDLTTLDDCRRVVQLEKLVWGYTDAEDVVPVPILVVTIKRGGILVGAFDEEGELVGFVYSLPGLKDRTPMQWSHMLGVVDRARDGGLGMRLKLEQRVRALDMGLDLIEWTFDPLQALNAHLNFAKLGVVVTEYEENIYGDSSSPLHRGTPTDRFVAEWWIRSPHVTSRLATRGFRLQAEEETRGFRLQAEEAMAAAHPVNAVVPKGASRICGRVDLTRAEPALLVEIPVGFAELQAQDPVAAREWRFATREIFTTYFGRGYQSEDFFLDRPNGVGRYLLMRKDR